VNVSVTMEKIASSRLRAAGLRAAEALTGAGVGAGIGAFGGDPETVEGERGVRAVVGALGGGATSSVLAGILRGAAARRLADPSVYKRTLMDEVTRRYGDAADAARGEADRLRSEIKGLQSAQERLADEARIYSLAMQRQQIPPGSPLLRTKPWSQPPGAPVVVVKRPHRKLSLDQQMASADARAAAVRRAAQEASVEAIPGYGPLAPGQTRGVDAGTRYARKDLVRRTLMNQQHALRTQVRDLDEQISDLRTMQDLARYRLAEAKGVLRDPAAALKQNVIPDADEIRAVGRAAEAADRARARARAQQTFFGMGA
jgi:hypothetical protein